jgi:hypothetical protein
MVLSDGPLDIDGRPVTVLAKKTAFTPAEEKAARQDLVEHPNLVPLYLPSFHPDNAFSRLMARNDPWAFARGYSYNVAPVTDNAPFLFFTLKAGQVLKDATTGRKGIDWKVNLGVLILLVVLVISIAAVLAFLLLPLLLHSFSSGQARLPSANRAGGDAGAQARSFARRAALPLAYFVAIGLGYMLVEITFVQRFVLFLGNPTYAITVVIFLLLLSSGAGSWISGTWLSRFGLIRVVLVAIVAVLLVEVAVLPRGLASLVGVPFFLKLLISGALLVPLGFAMGMPFPTGMRALKPFPYRAERITSDLVLPEEIEQQNTIEWAWAMNAGASVLGAVLAMVIAVNWGLGDTLACGAAAYLAALAVTPAFA